MHALDKIIEAQKRGEARGIPSICSAHPAVLRCAFTEAARSGRDLLIEATCNQSNQYGGYTGMTPLDFENYVRRIADETGLPRVRLILGGDHLGPSPWQELASDQAMQKSEALVASYVQAGFCKIHLDASAKLRDDDPQLPLDPQISAQRTARLAKVVESCASKNNLPRYVIGTEVPVPGGATKHEENVVITRTDDLQQTIDLTREAFYAEGLQAAWERVIAVVVQPGVEFGDDFILDYKPDKSRELSNTIETYPHFVYEAHSTDYQTAESLRRLVEGHFAILKVGPALSFAYREAVFNLAHIEEEYIPADQRSHIIETMEAIMLKTPDHWRRYYHGDEVKLAFARRFSLSDRIRYYWTQPEAQAAIMKLIDNLKMRAMPISLLSQYLPEQYTKIREEILDNTPESIINDSILRVILNYRYACGE